MKRVMASLNQVTEDESATVRQSIGQVFQDIVTLAELQGQLFQSDARELSGRIARPLVVFAAGALLFVVTVPVGLLAIVQCLVALGLPQAAAYGLVAVVGLVAAVGMAAWAWQRFRALPPAFGALPAGTGSEREVDQERHQGRGCKGGACRKRDE